MMVSRVLGMFLAVFVALGLTGGVLQAADWTDGGAAGVWSDSDNWGGGDPTNEAANIIGFFDVVAATRIRSRTGNRIGRRDRGSDGSSSVPQTRSLFRPRMRLPIRFRLRFRFAATPMDAAPPAPQMTASTDMSYPHTFLWVGFGEKSRDGNYSASRPPRRGAEGQFRESPEDLFLPPPAPC